MELYQDLSSLCEELGFSARALYSLSNRIGKHYHGCEIPKKSGGTRKLLVPDAFLKAVQRSIAAHLLAQENVSKYAMAYRSGGGVLKNAEPHLGKKMLLKLDVQHFFDSIIYPRIKDAAFPAEKYSEQNRILLAMLCTYHGTLPQGAPTSPVISNLVMREFDECVGVWCEKKDITYTRYCDDMSFSGEFEAAEIKAFVSSQLRKEGLFLNEKKTALLGQGQRMSVTGVTVNEKVSVPKAYRKQIRQEVFYCRRFGVEAHLGEINHRATATQYLQCLLGRINYVLSINPEDAEMRDYKNWVCGEIKRQIKRRTQYP